MFLLFTLLVHLVFFAGHGNELLPSRINTYEFWKQDYRHATKGISQDELVRHLGTKGPAIGRYEGDEMKPSIEVATKLAKIVESSRI